MHVLIPQHVDFVKPAQKKYFSFFISNTHIHYVSKYWNIHELFRNGKTPCLGIAALCTWLQIHPCQSLAQSQLPHLRNRPTLHPPPFPFTPPIQYYYAHRQHKHILLSGTLMTSTKVFLRLSKSRERPASSSITLQNKKIVCRCKPCWRCWMLWPTNYFFDNSSNGDRVFSHWKIFTLREKLVFSLLSI